MLSAKPGELIRHRATRELFLVLRKSPLGLEVVSLETRLDAAPILIVLPRAQSGFESDIKIVDMTNDEAAILKTKLKDVESVQEILERFKMEE